MNTEQVLMLKPLDVGADPTTFYAPLGCASDEGRLYRRSVEGRGTSEETQATWDALEMWRVEVCFFTADEGLSGWKRFAPSMGRGWFIPASAEAEAALDVYMKKLKPVNAISRKLEQGNGSLVSARLRLKRLKMSDGDDVLLLGDTTPERQEIEARIEELEGEIQRLMTRLKGVETRRQEAQGVLLTALGWEGLLEAMGGDNHG